MSMPLAVLIASSQSRELARSALPEAPSLERSIEVRAARSDGRGVRRRAARTLRRAANRLEPAAA